MNMPLRTGRSLRAVLTLATWLSAAGAMPLAAAQANPDPTRPMAAMLGDTADTRVTKPTRSGPPAAAASAVVGAAVAATPRLQSVRLAANPGASTALLDGRLLHVGDRVGENSVAVIDHHGITLRGPRGEQRLALLPGIRQTASREAPPSLDMLATGTLQDKKP
jgi:hypothetical protein